MVKFTSDVEDTNVSCPKCFNEDNIKWVSNDSYIAHCPKCWEKWDIRFEIPMRNINPTIAKAGFLKSLVA